MIEHLPMACADFGEVAAELALGTLAGHERADALAHIERCVACRALLDGLSLTSDALLQLAPTADPPVGFESRLFAALGGTRRKPERTKVAWISAVAGLAAAVTLVAGVGIVRLAGSHGEAVSRPTLVAGHTSAHLQARGASRGEVVVSGKPAWLFMTVEDAGAARIVGCQLTLNDGRKVRVGNFELSSGYGGWAAPLPVTPEEVRSAELLAPDGSVIASARFSA